MNPRGELYDLEMAYSFLETLPAGEDHRLVISETLRHLHIDRSGNTHRSEVSFDKFWNTGWEGGCRGLIEFRAVETLPKAHWMSAVALLWASLAAFLCEKKFTRPLVDHADVCTTPSFCPHRSGATSTKSSRDLEKAGLPLDRAVFREIWEYRFPQMLAFTQAGAELSVRKALESWPLLCETPLEGGSTSRYVDTSMERLEFTANAAFAATHRVFVQGRELLLGDLPGASQRRRATLPPECAAPIAPPRSAAAYPARRDDHRPQRAADRDLSSSRRIAAFSPPARTTPAVLVKRPCRKLRPELVTCDLRLA